MVIRISFFVVAFWIHGTALAQQPCVLRVVDDGAPVPGATVVLDGRPVGATNVSGEWVWVDGQGDLQIRALGYETLEWEEGCQTSNLELVLQASVVSLGGATVVGGMTPMRLKASPIRTAVISGASLAAAHTQDLLESLDFTTGVRESVACGVCGTNSVQLNGMEGVYSLVLLDGVPLLGGLASAYALDGLPISMVQQVEVIQGPASARFGSQAVGGVINVVLSPLHVGDAFATARMDGHGRVQVSGSGVFGREEMPWQIGLDGLHFQRRIDDNGDGFTDAPTMERLVATLRHQHSTSTRRSRLTARATWRNVSVGNWNSRSLTEVRTIPTANALTSPVPRSLGVVHLKVPKGGRFREEGRFTISRPPTGLRILRPERWLSTWMRFTRDGLGRRANDCEAA